MLNEKYILLLHKKLSRQISLSEASALRKYRDKHPEENMQLTEIEQLWDSSIGYEPVPDISLDKAKASFFDAISREESVTGAIIETETIQETKTTEIYQINRDHFTKNIWFRLSSVAAAVLIIIGAYFVIFTQKTQNVPDFMSGESMVQMNAVKSELTRSLADGTKLWLKEGSFFSYDAGFNKTNRNVYLEGELFIHVATNKNLPFNVIMAQNEVQVIGTAFYLKSDQSNHVQLKVQEGKVAISSEDQKILVVAGQEVDYDKTLKVFEMTDQNPVVNNWRNNYLIFDDVPLYTVFDKLSIFYGVEFLIDCERIDDMKGFTSLIQFQEKPKLKTYLQTLQKVYSIQIDRLGEETYKVSGDACK
jgi:ferric-dicitrate binding protein FerR (iron transport regulator)